jgi:hypothetical protein
VVVEVLVPVAVQLRRLVERVDGLEVVEEEVEEAQLRIPVV